MKKIVDMEEWYKYYKEVMQFYNAQYQYDNGYINATDNIDDWLEAQPDAEENRGKWQVDSQCKHKPCRIKNPEKWVKYKCSECSHSNGRNKSKYCPNCGAKMDLGEEE